MSSPRNVRFASYTDEIPPSPTTPSPTMTASSIGSGSSGPDTPSPASQRRRLPEFSKTPLPTGHIGLHKVLQYDSDSPQYFLDISYDPRSQRSVSDTFTKHVLEEAATVPPVEQINLVTRLPWKIVITPSIGNRFVTVGDLVGGLYAALREKTTEAEWAAEEPRRKRRIEASFRVRCSASEDPVTEQQRGKRRIDFLTGRIQFMGLWREDSEQTNTNTFRVSFKVPST